VKPVTLTAHARQVAQERDIPLDWIAQTVQAPAWREPDSAGVERRFRPIAEREGRILRVACVETDTETRVITAFFDRNARSPL
jgi:Domain of unknown function (DUF4258)